MILFPNAKINIGLNVVSRRDDGYHNIETTFVPVDWKDILEIVPSKSGETTLTVTGNHVDCPPEKNLVMKAYRALGDVVPLPAVEIHLHKIIPDGAGLGGGSSDASFTLKALNEMFALGLSREALAGIAEGLGADCPFFIYNTPMLATGTGTTFAPVALPLGSFDIAIVKPRVSVSTREAYAGVSPAPWDRPLVQLLSRGVESWQGAVVNDFEKSVFPHYPAIAGIKDRLEKMGAVYASMSGSGSAVYGLFHKGDIMAEQVAREFPESFCHVGTTM